MTDADCLARIIILAKQAGASNRTMAKFLGWSEPTFRRAWNAAVASDDADAREKANGNNSGDGASASNDASAALRTVLKLLPKLTAAERDVVRMELDILSM